MSFEVRLAQWIGLEYREKIVRRYKGKCDIFLGDRAQIEDGGNMEEQFNREAEE